jgi:tetratricopeptide (TPR) repeat protein
MGAMPSPARWMARLDRLAPVKEVAQIGAAIGREFSYELLAVVAHRPEGQLRDALDRLVEAGLIFRRGTWPQASFVFKHTLVQDAAYGSLLRTRRQELHASIGTALEERFAAESEQQMSAGEGAALLAQHWLRAEDWEKALSYTLEAAERALKLNACPEAVTHYWQVLDLLERLPPTLERSRIRTDIIVSLLPLPGWRRNEPGEATMLRHIDLALADAANGPVGTIVRLEALKGIIWNDDPLLVSAVGRAQSSGDASAQAFAALKYGGYLGNRDKLDKALGHIATAIDMLGATGERLEQAFQMASPGRCFFSRAGRLTEALAYAARAREAGDILDNVRLRAWRAMEAETYLYKGEWREVVRAADEALPAAWETGEWDVVLWSSAWAATANLKLGQCADARRMLDKALNEVPARGQRSCTIAVAQLALAQIHLMAGDLTHAFDAARRALDLSEQDRQRLEVGAAHCVLGQVHEAMDHRAEADAAFRRSIEVLEGRPISSRAGADAVGLRPLPARRQYPPRPRNDRARSRPVRGDERQGLDRGSARCARRVSLSALKGREGNVTSARCPILVGSPR